MATPTKNMTFDVNLLPATPGDHNLGSSSLKWNIFINQINAKSIASLYTFAAGDNVNELKITPDGFPTQTITLPGIEVIRL